MTNTEAIEKLEREKIMVCHDCMHPQMAGWCEEYCQLPEAFNMAINALKTLDLNKQVIELSNNSPELGNNYGESISKQAAIDAIFSEPLYESGMKKRDADAVVPAIYEKIKSLPSAQPDYQEVLGWLLAYHTKSFYLHGRYLPHEVISWLINDFTKEFIAERRTDEGD